MTRPPHVTVVVEELKHVPKSETVIVQGFIEEQEENCAVTLVLPDDFAEGLRLGDRLQIRRET